jgi:hypothetical protein
MCTTQGLGLRKRVLQSGTRHTSVIFLRLADLLSVPLFAEPPQAHVARCTSRSGRAECYRGTDARLVFVRWYCSVSD